MPSNAWAIFKRKYSRRVQNPACLLPLLPLHLTFIPPTQNWCHRSIQNFPIPPRLASRRWLTVRMRCLSNSITLNSWNIQRRPMKKRWNPSVTNVNAHLPHTSIKTRRKRRRKSARLDRKSKSDRADQAVCLIGFSHSLHSLSSAEMRRQIHIQSEQKRRAQIKDGFDELRKHLPGCNNKKMSKAALLTRSKSSHPTFCDSSLFSRSTTSTSEEYAKWIIVWSRKTLSRKWNIEKVRTFSYDPHLTPSVDFNMVSFNVRPWKKCIPFNLYLWSLSTVSILFFVPKLKSISPYLFSLFTWNIHDPFHCLRHHQVSCTPHLCHAK